MTGFRTLLTEPPLKRRVFFSFHYQQDIWRANQVRQSWRFRREGEREAEGFFDGSLWERSKRQGDDNLKALIREGMKNTSVTCVLAGTFTYSRRWVRYEIARSVVKGNGLLNVKIHSMPDRTGYSSGAGPNPLEQMGVYRADDGRILIAERDAGGNWSRYNDFTQAIDLPGIWTTPTSRTVISLSHYARTYDYPADNGGDNFPRWVSTAAQLAAR
jgi:Thoeris protein ThsB, TIR-like domain